MLAQKFARVLYVVLQAVVIVTVFAQVVDSSDKVLFCYFARWSIYRHGNGQFRHTDLDSSLCTHFVYAYLGLNETTSEVTSIDDWGDNRIHGGGMIAKAVQMKDSNAKLKVLVSIGGWSEGSEKFSKLAASLDKRRKFIDSVYNYLRLKQLDGVEIAWVVPTQRGGTPEDRANHVTLLEELSAKLRPAGLLLVVFVAAATTPPGIASRYDMAALAQPVDYINLIVSEFNGHWNNYTGLSAPLYSQDKKNIADAVDYVLSAGAPANKILMRFASYGQTFIMFTEPKDGVYLNVTAKRTFRGQWSNQDGFIGFNEICWELIKSPEADQWITYRDEESLTPFSVYGRKFISFDDATSFKEKVDFLESKGLAGASLFSLDTDDFRGLCYDGSKYPLTKMLMKSLRIHENRVIGSSVTTIDW